MLAEKIKAEIKNGLMYLNVKKSEMITECTACKRKGCLTDYLCHVATKEDAVKIIESGKLLSAIRARKESAALLVSEKRNAAKDPVDFFDYIMFSWGNCQAGDRLVSHPGCTSDGYHLKMRSF